MKVSSSYYVSLEVFLGTIFSYDKTITFYAEFVFNQSTENSMHEIDHWYTVGAKIEIIYMG